MTKYIIAIMCFGLSACGNGVLENPGEDDNNVGINVTPTPTPVVSYVGITGMTGLTGVCGVKVLPCTVKKNDLGVLITCPDGTSSAFWYKNKGHKKKK